MNIKEIKQAIEIQKEINIKLYKSIPCASRQDPLNEKAEPILIEWRNGSKELKRLESELRKLEMVQPKTGQSINKTFVNSYGEATKREITSTSYNNSSKKLNKEILSFIGSR